MRQTGQKAGEGKARTERKPQVSLADTASSLVHSVNWLHQFHGGNVPSHANLGPFVDKGAF